MKKKKIAVFFGLLVSLASCDQGVDLYSTSTHSDNLDTSSNTNISIGPTTSVSIQNSVESPVITEDVKSGTYDQTEGELLFNLSSTTITALSGGTGYAIDNNVITITSAGTYVFTGSLSSGQIKVAASKEDKVYIVLNGVYIKAHKNAAISSMSSDKTFIVLADNSKNYLEDVNSYVYEDIIKEEPNACLYSKDDLTIKGNGELTVKGNFNNGIGTKNDLKVKSGTFNISSINNGLKGNDSIEIEEGTKLLISSNGDGIKSDNIVDEEKGYILINGGEINVSSANDGIDCATDLTIVTGTISIKTGKGSIGSITSTSASMKGLKAIDNITINGGTFYLDSQDDAIHSNSDININSGAFDIQSGDDGIHADLNTNINGGDITINKSFEGIEGTYVNIAGGKIQITSSDDGINSAGGSDTSSSTGGRPGGWGGSSSSIGEINITGGEILINSTGDGIDSNKDIKMSGGLLVIFGPTSSGNGAVDYDGKYTMTGGTLIALGSSSMAMQPSSTTQCSVLVGLNRSLSAGTLLNLSSSSKELFTIKSLKSFNSLVYCSSDLTLGGTYTISTAGSHTGSLNFLNLYQEGSYNQGTKQTSFTISSSITNLNSSQGGGGIPF